MQPLPLIDRETESRGLDRVWSEAVAGRPQLVVVWGRRRVGKTYLLSAFVRGKRAVFFGAMTYIGNGPNFMVRSISQQSKVETPGFFAYVLKYAVPILLPLLGLISLLFFSPWRVF